MITSEKLTRGDLISERNVGKNFLKRNMMSKKRAKTVYVLSLNDIPNNIKRVTRAH